MELEKFRRWQQQKLEPANVVKLLNLDDNVGNAVKSRMLRRFDEYIIEFNKVNLNRQETLIGKQQLEGWLHSEKSVDDVFKLLEFKKDATAVVTRNMETLDNYIMLYNKAKSTEETLVGAFVKAFGETRLDNMLKSVPVWDKKSAKLRAQFNQWKREKSG
ncbi:hypothetical protein PC114_g18816 [Phytophthora cactorum]|nr:hypothetical protein PC114_g18816 [Phytophthora cactorum]KAG3000448.1 hypothetical protein PC120_g20696 [Phytophthora cactorum]